MPVTAPAACTMNDCLFTLIKTLGVMDMNYPDGSQVAVGSPYTIAELRKYLQDADYEVRILICKTQDNPHRETFYKDAETTDWLTNNSLVPASVSNHSTALIKETTLAADNSALRAKLAKNVHTIEKVQDKPLVFGSPKRLFYIHASRVLLGKSDAVIRFDVPRLLITVNTLYSPYAYKWGVIALAVTKCFLPGTNESHRNYWEKVWAKYQMEIEGRAMSLPEPEQLERIGA